MRLWHRNLIRSLPDRQLLGQHRECAALRGRGWGRPHRVVDYVFRHEYGMLFRYHEKVMSEMRARGFRVSPEWAVREYRGKSVGYDFSSFTKVADRDYPEHDDEYLTKCVDNLRSKGIETGTTGETRLDLNASLPHEQEKEKEMRAAETRAEDKH